MDIGFLYWLLMILSVIFWGWGNFTPQGQAFWPRGGSLLTFVLFALIGLQIFGWPVHR